jgi:hypothetical protein
MHRVVKKMRFGTPLPNYPGSLAACRREVKRNGGHIEYHCALHSWVVGEYCHACRAAGHG